MRFGFVGPVILAIVLAVTPVTGGLAQQVRGPQSVAELAAQLSPAVVNIGTMRRLRGGAGTPFPDFPEGSPLAELFNDLNPNSGLSQREARSLGSGFIIDAEGHVVTNNHVISGAEEIYVFLTDGRRLPATLVGHDDKTDIAVLKVEAGSDLPFVEFGDSDTAAVGDWVMAIGNPFGLGGSVTLGIVSARNRNINAGPYDDFIQTDASINQGNSGGPLFDMNGKVVGINTAIIARGNTSLGIGFAVPGNLANPIIAQLAAFGETRRGWLGVGIQEVTADIALTLGRPNENGAIVVDIDPAGPSLGVLAEGDLILEFDGRPVLRMRDLPRIVAETAVGSAVPVLVLREGQEQTLAVTLGRLEAAGLVASLPEEPASAADLAEPRGLADMIGLSIAELDETARERFGIDPRTQGILITDVAEGGDAAAKGLIAGLMIEEVNQVPVAEVADVEGQVALARSAGRAAVLFKVTDPRGASRYVAVRLN